MQVSSSPPPNRTPPWRRARRRIRAQGPSGAKDSLAGGVAVVSLMPSGHPDPGVEPGIEEVGEQCEENVDPGQQQHDALHNGEIGPLQPNQAKMAPDPPPEHRLNADTDAQHEAEPHGTKR